MNFNFTVNLKQLKKNLFLFCFLFLLLSCAAQNQKLDIFLEKEHPAGNKLIDKQKLTVELAITSAQQAKGFMGRTIIPEQTGMVFLYKEDRKLKFWMKNTPHPLSIAYIDSSGVIREIYDMIPYSLQTVSSVHSVRYALEVPKGMFERMGFCVGDKISEESILLLKRQLKNEK